MNWTKRGIIIALAVVVVGTAFVVSKAVSQSNFRPQLYANEGRVFGRLFVGGQPGDGTTPLRSRMMHVTARIIDVSTAGSGSANGRAYIVFKDKCTVKQISTVLDTIITSGDAVLTVYNNSFSPNNTQTMSGATVTIANSGSAAGTVDTATPTVNGSTDVITAGSSVSVFSDGGSSTTSPAYVTVSCIREPS